MKKVLIKLSFLFVPLLTILVSVNYNVDPGGKYSKQNFYKTVIDQLSKGKNIFITQKFHNHLGSKLTLNLIQNQKKRNHTTLLGSSRIIPVTTKMVHQEDFMNYGIHGAKLGDYVGMYEMLREKNNLPTKRLIIDLSPMLFMMNHKPTKGIAIPAYQRFIQRVQGKEQATTQTQSLFTKISNSFNHYAELLSPKYFQQSLKFYFKDDSHKKGTHQKFQFADETTKQNNNVIGYDNSRFKPINRKIAPAQKIFDSKSKISFSIFAETIDVIPETSDLFMLWLEELMQLDVELIFLVLPFDPHFYDEEVKTFGKNNILDKTDEYLKAVNNKLSNKLTIIGSTNPYDWGITREDSLTYYFDYAHLTSYGLTQILSRVKHFNEKKN